MLKAIILEDEENSRNVLSAFLTDYCPQVAVLAAVDSVAAGREAIRAVGPDVVFMDIELKGETSFDLLERLDEINFAIIFITAYDHYTMQAIKLSAVDYLLKPINVQELKTAIEKVEKRKSRELLQVNLDMLLNNLKHNYHDHQISIPSATGLDRVRISNIIHLESQNAYTHFFLKSGKKYIASKNIREYEKLLAGYNFFRIHKSYIVNLAEVTRYIKGEGGQVVLSNKVVLDVSRRRKDDFLKELEKL